MGDIGGEACTQQLCLVYSEIVHWKKNLFYVPSGSAGKSFVWELARLFRSFAENTALEPVSMYAAMTMPQLLLQKPTPNSRCKENGAHLERRLGLWKSGNFAALVEESRAIQYRLSNQNRRMNQDHDNVALTFSKLMFQGRTRAALRLLDKSDSKGLLSLDSESIGGKTVRGILKEKQPKS